HHVTIAEKRPDRHKACGDSINPRTVAELARIGLDPLTLDAHPISGLRMTHGDRSVQVPWPAHPDFPTQGYVLRRSLLDPALRAVAADAGAEVLMGHEAITPIAERGFVRGATLQRDDGSTTNVRARFVVVADGANSRFGRGLGTTRDRNWPYGIATRTYFASGCSHERWIEAMIGLPDASGAPIAGVGWVAPEGDGTVNVGVGVLSSHRDVRSVNAVKLLASFAARVAERWEYDPDEPLKHPTRFRVPLGGSVGPKMGPTFLVAGDAAGMANPFNGAGVDAALMTGRVASAVLDEALTSGNSTALQRYPSMLDDEVGRYNKVGRLTARFVGRPPILRPLLRFGMRSDAVMGGVLRIAANALRSGEPGAAERAYAIASLVSRSAPSW
ncbi:MAG: NAD(P)/FAD-dependent oxidoreductase, partial [Ilumatobacteraceae bacterium]